MTTSISDLLTLRRRLSDAQIHHRPTRFRDDAVAVEVIVPGERWEIEFLEEGTVEVERFTSDGTIQGSSALDDLFSRFSD